MADGQEENENEQGQSKESSGSSTGSSDPKPESGSGVSEDLRKTIREELQRILPERRASNPGTESPRAIEQRIAEEVNRQVKETLGDLPTKVASSVKKSVEEAPKQINKLRKALWGDDK